MKFRLLFPRACTIEHGRHLKEFVYIQNVPLLATVFNSTAMFHWLSEGRIPKEFNIISTAEFEKTAGLINMQICSKVLGKAKSR